MEVERKLLPEDDVEQRLKVHSTHQRKGVVKEMSTGDG